VIDGTVEESMEIDKDDFCVYACSTSQSKKDQLSLLANGVSSITVRLYRDAKKVQQGACGKYMVQIARIIERPLGDGFLWRNGVFMFQTRGTNDMERFLNQKTHQIRNIAIVRGLLERHNDDWKNQDNHDRGMRPVESLGKAKAIYSLNQNNGTLSQGPSFASAQTVLMNPNIGLVSCECLI
jgi:hypothetical protein